MNEGGKIIALSSALDLFANTDNFSLKKKKTFANGVHIKFTGDCGIIAPALIAEEKHIDEMIQKIKEVVVKY